MGKANGLRSVKSTLPGIDPDDGMWTMLFPLPPVCNQSLDEISWEGTKPKF